MVKKKVTPEVTDEWAKEKMGFESVEDMRERIKESLNAQKGSLMPRIKENNIMVELRDRVEGDVPESLVEQAETSLLQDFFGQLQQAGMTFDAYLASQNITPDQFKADLKAQSADQVKEELALEAWARHNNMEITDADVTAEFAKTGVEDPAALEQEWRDAGRLHLIRTGLFAPEGHRGSHGERECDRGGLRRQGCRGEEGRQEAGEEEGCQEGRGRRGRRVASNKMRFRKGGLIPPFLLGVSQKRATGYSSVAQTVLARQNRTFSPVLFAAELAW